VPQMPTANIPQSARCNRAIQYSRLGLPSLQAPVGLPGQLSRSSCERASPRIHLSSDQRAETVTPYDPHHFLHHLHHRDETREQGQRPPEDLTFYDRVAEALRDVDRIVLLSHGTGVSNASNVLTERLKKHHPGIYARIIRQPEVNTSAMTEAEILAYGRQALATDAQGPL
jgi:hypothetical protein